MNSFDNYCASAQEPDAFLKDDRSFRSYYASLAPTISIVMAASYRLLPEEACIIQTFEGDLRMADVTRLSEAIWRDPCYDRNFQGITDLRAASVVFHPYEVRDLAEFFANSPSLSQGKWAIVVDRPLETAFATLFAAHIGSSLPISVFYSWESACLFLRQQIPDPMRQCI